MERKSIGAFIASLRREKGMTQKQLAQLLNVSDKAISRWERDESQPDLNLIPVLGELFSVTSDELLRGCRSENPRSQDQSPETVGSSYSGKTVISIFLAAASVLTALWAAYGLKEGNRTLGFLFCVFFCLGSAAFQTASALQALRHTKQDKTCDQIIGILLNIYVMLISVIAGTSAILNRLVCLSEFIFWFTAISLPLSGILIRIKWFVAEPMIAARTRLFQTTQGNTSVLALRKETSTWDLLLLFCILWYCGICYGFGDVAFIFGVILLIIEIPVSTLIYLVRKTKLP